MSKEKELINKGKHLAFLLRHDKEAFDNGLIDENGWRNVSELVKEQGYTRQMLDEITDTNDKKRYEFNLDKSKIRARQGHSIPVDVDLKEVIPPPVLYHGTATRFLDSIYEKGIISGSRLYVHLSSNEETATKVGMRHGTPYILKVDTEKMHEDGYKFYISNNNVWLTKEVPTKYLVNHSTLNDGA